MITIFRRRQSSEPIHPPLSERSGAYGHIFRQIFPFCEFSESFNLALVNRNFYLEFLDKISQIVVKGLNLEPGIDHTPYLLSRLNEYKQCVPPDQRISDDAPSTILVMRIFKIVCQVLAFLSKEQAENYLLGTMKEEFHCFEPLLNSNAGGLNLIPPVVSLSMHERWEECYSSVIGLLNEFRSYKQQSIEVFLVEFVHKVLPFLQEMKSSERGSAVCVAAREGDVDFVRLLLATGEISERFRQLALKEVESGSPIARLLRRDIPHEAYNCGVESDED